jgi:hypothetical protein
MRGRARASAATSSLPHVHSAQHLHRSDVQHPRPVQAMVGDGILYGCGGFRWAALGMALAAAPALAVMWLALPEGPWGHGAAAEAALIPEDVLRTVWLALGVLMLGRLLSTAVPFVLRAGPFATLKEESQ